MHLCIFNSNSRLNVNLIIFYSERDENDVQLPCSVILDFPVNTCLFIYLFMYLFIYLFIKYLHKHG